MKLLDDVKLLEEIEAAIAMALPESMLTRIIHDISSTGDDDELLVETNLVSPRDESEEILGTETIRYRKSDRKILEHESDSTE